MKQSDNFLVRLGHSADAPVVQRSLPRYEKMRVLVADPRGKEIILERFFQHVVKGKSPDECWGWKGSKSLGYGIVIICADIWKASRLSFLLHNGRLNPDLQVCHHCDNPPCSNPLHLFEGTMLDNQRDSCKKGRHPFGENSKRAILTEEIVKTIRAEYIPRVVPQWRLARKYGVSQMCVSKIITRDNWKHV